MTAGPADAERAIAEAAARYSNWGRWGEADVLGTLNFLNEAKRAEGAALVRLGVSFSLSLRFEASGPQNGWRRRVNPVHTMLDTGTDAALGNQGFPHGIGGADDMITMPLQCATQWDGLGHIFDHGKAWNGRPAEKVVTSGGDLVTGIEHMASQVAGRAVLLDAGRVAGTAGELPDGFAITEDHLTAAAAAHGVTVGRGDIVLVRTGRLARARREGWGDYAGGPSPGLSFTTAGWLHRTEIAAIATDTWGVEVRPNEFPGAFQPLHQVAIPHLGLLLGEMWDLDALAAHCAADGVYEFWLTAAPLPITGAVGSPVNPIAVKLREYGNEQPPGHVDRGRRHYTWFDRLLVPCPWHRGRVVLAGDAVHSCPPTLAQGAAMSLEDVFVLAELLGSGQPWDDRLLTAYCQRRLPRVRQVVDASVQLGQWLMDGVRDADVTGLIGRTMAMVAQQP